MPTQKLKLLSFSGNTKILHLSWMAFFISFVVWFNHAPLLIAIQQTLGLSDQQIKTILILNVALTIPARIVVGMLVDKFGPRITFPLLLGVSSIICFFFALAQNFEQLALARFMLGFVGAGFVIGIRMISEWYPAKQVGLASGIYGGLGNFGAAGAAVSLPTIAQMFGGDDGWRYAVALTGVIALIYAFIYYNAVSDTPKGSTYFKPKKSGGLEVTSKGDLYFYLFMNIPMYAALAVLAWKLSPSGVSLLTAEVVQAIYIGLFALYFYQAYHIYQVNKEIFVKAVPTIHRYKFKQIAVLDLAYMVAFGSELAVVSMLPLFFFETFQISVVQAGILASSFAFMNLVSRPTGGWLSDRFGRKNALSICIAGLSIGYYVMSQITSEWSIALAVLASMACAFFVNAGCGAVFAVVPLVQRRLTGQIAGMAGAYGNIGALIFLTILSLVTTETFFLVIAATAIVTLLAVQFMDEPKGQMAEILPDGTVQMIDVN
ncbi:MAG: NarK family nitrate/nitrite MFS transporter [Gammaproteobacteria bacterium]|jgi:MFS transporter, NNP family, nitrate/nitrite transporter|nr:NarK family nitrate/nitrite MFS transporter [Gammaproteobacteria bacterium]MBT4145921.1 NarK family nitrate/nitrite MFS transporter [Gammaproteobacteria bacterium]MBT5223374.1 NarK family nitrate/nitrite MFS transporter [Gammaproteobacteria bacterium]MBT5825352.1 NarK family nitrate/nitrite MFS transporter [Gammaproteobacteria bacterium]MBT6420044.1 NarK family nitrate/nitrite MFS transporter [Gammaproteobacteria bacterium]